MRVGIIGAGPAGLTAAYQLCKAGIEVDVFEAGPAVGGMAASFDLWGHRVDLGPHRFFSRDARVNRLWLEVMGSDYRMVERQTRILYRNRLYDYPLRAANALANMGLIQAALCVLSYAKTKMSAGRAVPDTFEDWVVARFGRRLFEMFFKSYSEKLWGIACTELNADFAVQRIKGFSLGQALLAMIGLAGARHRTLADSFAYPKAGNGEVYARMAKAVIAAGGRIHLATRVQRVLAEAGQPCGMMLEDGRSIACDHVISTMPLTLMVRSIGQAPTAVLEALDRLRFRNTILVYLRVARTDLFVDQWLYVHAPELRCGRVTNFRNWVPELYGDLETSVLALEYWCNDDDAIWRDDDGTLVALATREIAGTGLVDAADVAAGHVLRVPRCYPVYGRDYRENLAPVVRWLQGIDRLWPIGRYGSFKYNNQDHSILMGLLAAENIVSGAGHDLWAVNSDDVYQEGAVITAEGLVAAP